MPEMLSGHIMPPLDRNKMKQEAIRYTGVTKHALSNIYIHTFKIYQPRIPELSMLLQSYPVLFSKFMDCHFLLFLSHHAVIKKSRLVILTPCSNYRTINKELNLIQSNLLRIKQKCDITETYQFLENDKMMTILAC